MSWFKTQETRKIPAKPAALPAPATIIDNFVARQRTELNHHAARIEALSELIADATERLHYHTQACNGLKNLLSNIGNEVELPNDFFQVEKNSGTGTNLIGTDSGDGTIAKSGIFGIDPPRRENA